MQKLPIKFILLLVLIAGLMFLVFRPFAYVIAMALGITLGVVAIVYLAQFITRTFRKFRMRNSIEGIITEKVDAVINQARRLEKDVSTIKVELADINVQIQDGNHSNMMEDKLLRLKEEFEVELELKQEKIAFFDLTIKRFRELLSDQKVLKKIASKKSKLQEVRHEKPSNNPSEDYLSSDKEVIEELDYLTLRMQNTVHIDEAKDIQKDLIELYR